MTPLAAYLLLFLAVGVGFIFVHLVAGKLIRPSKANAEKETIYECGEPTIGSAWIQFDLRFYVVALLFVVFDVEVAFFFPWAEVFGKANALRDTPPPQTAAEYREMARKVLEFETQPTDGKGQMAQQRERAMWEALRTLDDKDLELYQSLRPEVVKLAQMLGMSQLAVKESLPRPLAENWQRRVAMLQQINPSQVEAMKKAEAQLEAVLGRIQAAQKAQLPAYVKAVENLPPEAVKEFNALLTAELRAPMQVTTHARNFLTSTEARVDLLRLQELQELAKMPVVGVTPLSEQPANVVKEYQRQLPEPTAVVFKNAAAQHAELVGTVNKVLADLKQIGPTQGELWEGLTVENLKTLSDLKPEQVDGFKLPPATLMALEARLAPRAQESASTLAWLALVEILVFFGVLLVGFAYLWRRGDLAWVRSTAAETETRQPTPAAADGLRDRATAGV